MYSRLKAIVLLTIALLLVAGCTPAHIKRQEQVNQVYRNEVDALLSEPGDINRKSPKQALSPLMAAAFLLPERIPEMIAAGADVNYAPAGGSTALHILVIREYYYRAAWADYGYGPYNDSHELAAIEALLKAGADPNAVNMYGSTPAHLVTNPSYNYPYGNSALVKGIERITLLVKYGADLSLRDNSDRTPYEHLPTGNLLTSTWADFKAFVNDVQEEGLETALFNYHHREEIQAQARREKEVAEAERQRKRQVAREIARQKRELITRSFNENPDLRAALTSLKESARPCFTLGDMYRKADDFNCIAMIEGSAYPSKSCEDYQRQLLSVIENQRDQICSPYRQQRKHIANLFAENSSIADSVIGKSLTDLSHTVDIERQYLSEIRRMKTIRDREIRSERAEEDRVYQQGIYNYMQSLQSSAGANTAADQIIQKSVADTQRTLYAIDSAQKMAKINADLEAINKQLRNIKTTSSPPSAASSTPSYQSSSNQPASPQSVVTKKECVAQSESKGAMPNVPQRYCQYVFSDNTDTVKVNWDDYSNQFNEESGSLQQAQKNIGTPLLKKARQVCEGRGYKRVHHPETYQFNQVASQVTDCKENSRLGSTFHLCIGTASFICAR
jgi:hypothetical protein